MPLNVVRSKGIRKAAPAAPPQLNYHGGPLLANPEVTTIYWGSAWNSDPLRAQMDAFFDVIVTSSLLAQLAEYNVPGFTIGRGKHVQSVTISSDPANPLDDSQIQSMLDSLIADGTDLLFLLAIWRYRHVAGRGVMPAILWVPQSFIVWCGLRGRYVR